MEIKVDGRLLVSTLCERFKEEFGGTLRVYKGNKRCNGSEKVAEVSTSTGAYECRGSKTVCGFKKDLMSQFGIKVQVASADDWVLALDEMTLAKLPDIPKNATKAQMENLKSKYGKNLSGQCSVDGIEYEITDGQASAFFDNKDNRATIIIPDVVLFQGVQCPVVDVELLCRNAKTLELGKNIKYLMGGNDLCKLESVIVNSPKGFLENGFDDMDVQSFFKVPIQYKG